MSDEQTKMNEVEEPQAAKPSESKRDKSDEIFIVPYPKVVFLYPTLLVTLGAAILMTIFRESWPGLNVLVSTVFLITLTVNLAVLTVDFPRATSLTLFFVAVAIGLGLSLLAILKPEVLPFVGNLIQNIRPEANAAFYWIFAVILGSVFVIVKIKIQFDYWEVRRNEILHHHGVLSDLRRYPTSGLQVEKEINDVFEYLLMRSGRLILKPAGENRAFVLDNVPNINTREAQLTQMLSAIKVKVHAS